MAAHGAGVKAPEVVGVLTDSDGRPFVPCFTQAAHVAAYFEHAPEHCAIPTLEAFRRYPGLDYVLDPGQTVWKKFSSFEIESLLVAYVGIPEERDGL